MTNTQTVSVIVPVYNGAKYLDRCVISIQNQTNVELEIILVNDGSTDESGMICDSYAVSDNRIRVIHKVNGGISSARNAGLEIARGDYISFIDADDYIRIDTYETLLRYSHEGTIDVINFGCNYVDEAETSCIPAPTKGLPYDRVITHDMVREYMQNANQYTFLWFVWRNIYKRELLATNNIKFIEGNIIEDTPFNMQAMLSANSIYVTSDIFYYYVQTANSLTRERYKSYYLERLENLYNAKCEIYRYFKIVNWEDDLNQYTLSHTLNLLLANVIAKNGHYYEEIKAIGNSPMIRNGFAHAKCKGTYSQKILNHLMKWKMYSLITMIIKSFKMRS